MRFPGLGPAARGKLADLGIRTNADLAWLAPIGWDDLRTPQRIADASDRAVVGAVVKSASMVPLRGRRGLRVVLVDPDDEKCTMHASWFYFAQGILAVAKPGVRVIATGQVIREPKKPPRMLQPDLVLDTPENRIARARYPKIGVPEATLRKAVQASDVLDPVPSAIVAREKMPPIAPIVRAIHATSGTPPTAAEKAAFVERLAWVEALATVQERLAAEAAGAATSLPRVDTRLEAELGFAFTADQRRAIDDIASDLERTTPMRRLLLGDVGTGKTAVALAAVAQCVCAGKAAAILAPTSVLAAQYEGAVAPLVRATGARVVVLGAGADRREALARVADGVDLVVGTHALLEEDVVIPRLALVIVDEQQRLGVGQRLSLVKKGTRPHLLTLSATPIPRTLALALRGSLATSTLREAPAGRRVTTELATDERAVIAEVAKNDGRTFWIVPRIADEDGAESRHRMLAKSLDGVGILTGAMPAEDKRAAMARFRSGELRVLVATTVIEVGIDVPEATLVVIEQAERFGLAQLHQLRGRVGRGRAPGRCILLHRGAALARLEAFTSLRTGEDVARADLALRGPGDFSGKRQHGDAALAFLDETATYPWLERIEDDARALLATDPGLAAHPALASLVRQAREGAAHREGAG